VVRRGASLLSRIRPSRTMTAYAATRCRRRTTSPTLVPAWDGFGTEVAGAVTVGPAGGA
jgi:hypothetical protein